MTIKNDREKILARLSANQPLTVDSLQPPLTVPALTTPKVNNASADALLQQFCTAAKNNAATIAEVRGMENIPAAAAEYLRDNNIAPKLLCSPALAKLNWQKANINAECRAATTNDNCAITEVIAAAADTGAMLVSNQTQYQLTHSLLPPVHIGVLSAKTIMPALPQVWQQLEKQQKDNNKKTTPLLASLFCGPSRTGDIEQTITLGAHGPLRVHIIIYK